MLVEVDEYGVPVIFLVRHAAGYWQVNVKVPPGIPAGDHAVRVGTRGAGFSDPVSIRMLPFGAERRYGAMPFVEGPVRVAPPVFARVENTMDRSTTFRGYRNESLACRFTHSEDALDLSRVQLTIDGRAYPLLSVERPQPGMWQVNARLKDLTPGEHALRLRTSESGFSEPFMVTFEPAFAS